MKKEKAKKNTAASMGGGSCYSLQLGNAQHQGAREYQEDYFGFSDISPESIETRGLLAVLCDGMGGLKGGRETAIETVTHVLNIFKNTDFRHGFYNNMSKAIVTANDMIYSKHNSSRITTGCTFVSAYVYENKLYWACVGDSRIYLVRNGQMYALNEDHDYLNRLLARHIQGDCSLKAAMSDSQKDNLVSFIGCQKLKVDISRSALTLKNNDSLLLCSDGVYNSLSECEMLRCVSANEAHAACDKIVESIVRKGKFSQDNLSVMLVKFREHKDGADVTL